MGPRGGDELNLILPRPQLRLAARVRTAAITTACRSRDHRRGAEFEAAQDCPGTPSISPTEPGDLHRQSVSAMEGQRLHRRAVGQGADPRPTFNGDQARKADQWDMGAAHPLGRPGAATARSICSRTAPAAGCCGSNRKGASDQRTDRRRERVGVAHPGRQRRGHPHARSGGKAVAMDGEDPVLVEQRLGQRDIVFVRGPAAQPERGDRAVQPGSSGVRIWTCGRSRTGCTQRSRKRPQPRLRAARRQSPPERPARSGR